VCPELDRAYIDTLGLPLDGSQAIALTVAATRACYQRLVAAGADLAADNTTENAADVADLRVALGIRQWNVFGVSYGTNLAMTYMRQYPRGIRSVTLDSVEPPEVIAANLFAANARAGFGNLFRACTEQPQCWRRSPGIAQTFTDLVRRLEAHPVTTWVEPPAGGSPVKVVLDRGRLVNWLINESENTPDYRNVPAMIAELADGDPRPIATEDAAQALSSGIGLLGYGLALGVGCAEWIPYMKDALQPRARETPLTSRRLGRPRSSSSRVGIVRPRSARRPVRAGGGDRHHAVLGRDQYGYGADPARRWACWHRPAGRLQGMILQRPTATGRLVRAGRGRGPRPSSPAVRESPGRAW
jgi:pimeloyl-ACP methyl ester carboxylesterase